MGQRPRLPRGHFRRPCAWPADSLSQTSVQDAPFLGLTFLAFSREHRAPLMLCANSFHEWWQRPGRPSREHIHPPIHPIVCMSNDTKAPAKTMMRLGALSKRTRGRRVEFTKEERSDRTEARPGVYRACVGIVKGYSGGGNRFAKE